MISTPPRQDSPIIPDGSFIVARKIFESDLWERKPAEWVKIWLYILGHVHHTDYKELKRGQGYFNMRKLSRLGAFGERITYPMIDHFLRYAKDAGMLAKTKATHGTLITVCNYNLYQSLSNYKSETTSDAKSDKESEIKETQERNKSDNINKNDNNGKNEKTVTKNGFLTKLPILTTDNSYINYLVDEILTVTKDAHSRKFYESVAARISEDKIRQALSEIKVDGANSPAKLFTWKIKILSEKLYLLRKGEMA